MSWALAAPRGDPIIPKLLLYSPLSTLNYFKVEVQAEFPNYLNAYLDLLNTNRLRNLNKTLKIFERLF